MRKTYAPFLALVLLAVPLTAYAQPFNLPRGPVALSSGPAQRGPASSADTLYAQYTGGEDYSWPLSENFEEELDGADSYLADDFDVPTGASWSVAGVSIFGAYGVVSNGSFERPPDFNVILWADDDGQPGETEVARFDEISPTSDRGGNGVEGEILIDFDSPVALSPGKYWLTVQANLNFSANQTRFLWFSSATEFGEPAQLFNYGGGLTDLGSCNIDWGPNAACGLDGTGEPSLYFQILGTNLAVANESGAAPQRLALGKSYPNPAVSVATVPFSLDRAQRVRLSLFDVLGREVFVAADEVFAAGDRTVEIDVSALPNGLYIYRVATAEQTLARRLVVAR